MQQTEFRLGGRTISFDKIPLIVMASIFLISIFTIIAFHPSDFDIENKIFDASDEIIFGMINVIAVITGTCSFIFLAMSPFKIWAILRNTDYDLPDLDFHYTHDPENPIRRHHRSPPRREISK